MQIELPLRKRANVTDTEQDFTPVLIREIELSQPLPVLLAFDEQKKQTYHSIRCLIRLHTLPLGLVDFVFYTDEVSPHTYAPLIWQTLGEQINLHLREDGLTEVTALTASGLPSIYTPKCVEDREIFLQTAPFVSVVVPTHDRPEVLATTLQTLLALHYPHFEIIVVDNAPSTPKTAEVVRSLAENCAHLRYVREDNPGPSCARNRGILEAKGEIIAFSDDDVTVDTYWLAHIVKGFTRAENVACVTSLVLPQELDTPAQVWFEEYGGFTKGFNARVFDRSQGSDTPFHPFTAGRFGTGAGMAFTADFFRREGGFDPALRTGQDIAEFFRVIICGYKLVYEPASFLYHQHRRGYEQLRKQLYSYGSGLTAYLTKSVMDRPWLLFKIGMLLPRGVIFVLSSHSEKNQKKSSHFPRELTSVERRGMLRGPWLYFMRRRKTRHLMLRPAYHNR